MIFLTRFKKPIQHVKVDKNDSVIESKYTVNKYHLRFWFEHGGTCLWAINEKAKNKYDYAIKQKNLPISAKIKA